MVPKCAKSSLKPILSMLLWKMKPVETYLNIFRNGSIESEWHDYLKDLATWGWNQEWDDVVFDVDDDVVVDDDDDADAAAAGGGDTEFSGKPPFPRYAELSEEDLLFSH